MRSENKEQSVLIIGAALFVLSIMIEKLINLKEIYILLLYILSYLVLGGKVIIKAVKNIFKGEFLDENFLMSIATLGAFYINEYTEAVAVMLFYQIGEYFQDLAVDNSKKSIKSLMDLRPDYANQKINSKITKVSPENLEKGDTIVIKPGEKVPVDAVVLKGESLIDTSSITGEFKLKNVTKDDMIYSGTVNQTGLLTCKVIKKYEESTASKIIELVESSMSKKSRTEKFITVFSRYYTPLVVFLALLVVIIPPILFNENFTTWFNRGLIFLVISCPCALVLSVPLSYFGGIGNASKKGILIKESIYLDAVNNLETVVFDKTGTLTKGKFQISKIINNGAYNKEDVLRYAAVAESFSNHPIAKVILEANKTKIDTEKISDYKEKSGCGVSAVYNNKTILAGNSRYMYLNKINYEESIFFGSKVYVALDNEYIGCIIVSDEIKSGSVETINYLKKAGLKKIVMLTGDNNNSSEEYAKKLRIDTVYAELLPKDKVDIVEKLLKERSKNGKLLFIGDGINDAPVLARSDVGISMGMLGSDAAIEASDIVFMTDEIIKLKELLKISKFTKRIVIENISLSLGVKMIILFVGVLGFATMWEAVFADVGVSLIAILNSTRILKMK